MTYSATIVSVMIASPGDVAEERRIVRDVLHDWNDVNSANSRVVLAPVGWETHSSPELGTRPQELINERVLRDCDLLIGVFWTRLGTPTGESESGTVEEIRTHLSSGKPAMIYFSSRPVAPESLDPTEYARVHAFKKECKSLGLIEEYDDAVDFRGKLSRHIQICLRDNAYIRSRIGTFEASNETAAASSGDDTSHTKGETVPSGVFPTLSEDATELLKAAAGGEAGTILNVRYLGGHRIQAGAETFGHQYGRESARWEHALAELVSVGLVVARGYKGEVFELTHLGWKVADELMCN